MKIIKFHELSPGDIIDFTTNEVIYWNKRLAKNEVVKTKCPYCSRMARTDEFFECFDHVIRVSETFSPEILDGCQASIESCLEVKTILQTVALGLTPQKERFSNEAWTIARLRGLVSD